MTTSLEPPAPAKPPAAPPAEAPARAADGPFRTPAPAAEARRTRRFERDEIVRVGAPRRGFDDLYHHLLDAPWSRLLLLVLGLYFGLNAFFATLYLLGGDCIVGAEPGSFRDAFFFSLQTLATIGYGVMAPKGTYANAVVTCEAFVGLLGVAMASGLMFAKFARPTARVLFSDKMVIAPRNGVPCLMFRMANARGNDIVEASVRLSVVLEEITREGERMRRVHELKLLRSQSPLFVMTFTAMHLIDEASPLFGHDERSLLAEEARFIVTFTGLDGTFAQTVYARATYVSEDVVWNARFADVMSDLPDGRLQVDYSRFQRIEPLPPPSSPTSALPS